MGQAISLTDMLSVVHGRPYVDVCDEGGEGGEDERREAGEDGSVPKPGKRSRNRVSQKKVVIVVPSSHLRIRAGDS